nr:hypothetical protein [Oceanobacter mangrovi]
MGITHPTITRRHAIVRVAEYQQQDSDAAFDVILASTGARIRVSESETITAALAREGVEIPVSAAAAKLQCWQASRITATISSMTTTSSTTSCRAAPARKPPN